MLRYPSSNTLPLNKLQIVRGDMVTQHLSKIIPNSGFEDPPISKRKTLNILNH